ncbi:hypothetical protein FAIPA1_100089 [Frankia sp. AiPs1]
MVGRHAPTRSGTELGLSVHDTALASALASSVASTLRSRQGGRHRRVAPAATVTVAPQTPPGGVLANGSDLPGSMKMGTPVLNPIRSFVLR